MYTYHTNFFNGDDIASKIDAWLNSFRKPEGKAHVYYNYDIVGYAASGFGVCITIKLFEQADH